MFGLNKYNNSYFLYKVNRYLWKRKNKKAKREMSKRDYNKFLKSQKECIWCKRIHTNDSYFCSEKCEMLYNKEKFQSFKHNNRCEKHKHGKKSYKLTYKNQCWECYKKEFKEMKIPFLRRSFSLKLHGFKTIPTFRTSKDNWNGDKVAFEQYLVDNNVDWFVYIKFYVNPKGFINPIVVGKSGSRNVNASGSDLNFSTDVKDGLARRLIKESNSEWHYDHIMIKKVKNERVAYKLETKIANKYNLFGS